MGSWQRLPTRGFCIQHSSLSHGQDEEHHAAFRVIHYSTHCALVLSSVKPSLKPAGPRDQSLAEQLQQPQWFLVCPLVSLRDFMEGIETDMTQEPPDLLIQTSEYSQGYHSMKP